MSAIGVSVPTPLEAKTIHADIDECIKNSIECLYAAITISEQLLGFTITADEILPKLENEDIVSKIDYNKDISEITMNMLNEVLSRI